MVKRSRRLAHAEPPVDSELLKTIRAQSHPLQASSDLDPLMERIGDASYVLLGEASHGTHEFYSWRASLTRRLIEERGFSFLAVEGDWPDCYRVNRYVKGFDDDGDSAHEVLRAFERWPTWMWANEEIVELVEWLRVHNEQQAGPQRVGFFGLDVYSLWDSLYHVLGYLAKHDPDALPAARRAFQCFEPYGEDVQAYARATRWVGKSCEQPVIELLTRLRRESRPLATDEREANFNAEQNAIVVKNAENYYRTMVHGGPDSWNVRDQHMVQTLQRLMHHHGPQAKTIVWEHNTHIGDARFTDMTDDGMVNVGQLVREQNTPQDVVLVGFSSHRGSVIAADAWEAPMERMRVPGARSGSWEDVLHQACGDNRLLLSNELAASQALLEERGHRAIGVVYHPQYEHLGNYVPTVLGQRYDALLYLEQTEALRPLHDVHIRHEGDLPETYPTGF